MSFRYPHNKKKISLLCKIYGGKILHSGVYYDDDRGHKLEISKIDKLICKNFLFVLNTLLMPIHVLFFFNKFRTTRSFSDTYQL